jgi:predicted  nucleic acid-binding Zn-ribbon protein
MNERPPFGTAPIRCGKTRCKWRGHETELAEVPHAEWAGAMQKVCPACGCDSYMFMTKREIAAWERSRAAAVTEETQ